MVISPESALNSRADTDNSLYSSQFLPIIEIAYNFKEYFISFCETKLFESRTELFTEENLVSLFHAVAYIYILLVRMAKELVILRVCAFAFLSNRIKLDTRRKRVFTK